MSRFALGWQNVTIHLHMLLNPGGWGLVSNQLTFNPVQLAASPQLHIQNGKTSVTL